MVVLSLTLGAVAGVLLSTGFVWVEVGRYAAPQVPVTLFDERKVLAAYTVGLFAGIPLAAAYLLLLVSVANAALPGAALFLGGLVVGAEAGQLLLTRSKYWGASTALPFYVVSFRAGIGGILALAAVALYLGGTTTVTALGLGSAIATAVALVGLEVTGALVSLRPVGLAAARAGGPVAGGLFAVVAFFLLALGPVAGPGGSLAAAIVVLAGSALAYRGRRRLLAEVPPPTGPAPPTDAALPRAFGRTPLPAGAPGAPLSPPDPSPNRP